jgi:arylsulfatase A-like enzyme
MAAGLALLTALVMSAGGCDSQASRVPMRALEPVPFADATTLAAFDGWDERPQRIILIVADTLRRDVLSFYGGAAHTPTLDALAERSQVFRNAFSSYYQTSMSMGSLFTGRTPSLETGDSTNPIAFGGFTWCGMARFAGPKQKTCIPKSVPTLGQAMRRAGYWTIGVASNGFLFKPYGADRGFDDWNEVGERMRPIARKTPEVWKRIIGARSAEVVNRTASRALMRRRSDNFFFYLHYMDVHDYLDIEDILDLTNYGDKSEKYLAAVARLDEAIGKMLGGLETAGLMEGTAIVFTADHGERLADEHFLEGTMWHMGNPSFDEVISVPLVVTPRISDNDEQLMRTEDSYRLVTRLAGSTFGGEEQLARDELFLAEPKYQTYRRGRWKSYIRREDGVHHLVDLDADPAEATDVAAMNPEVVAEHAERIAELTQKLAAQDAEPAELSQEDIRRLRELGYME